MHDAKKIIASEPPLPVRTPSGPRCFLLPSDVSCIVGISAVQGNPHLAAPQFFQSGQFRCGSALMRGVTTEVARPGSLHRLNDGR